MKQNKSFLILGITGGAGSGKTTVVEEIEKLVPAVFLHCDVIAHELMKPGGPSYVALVEEFGEEILETEAECCAGEVKSTKLPVHEPAISRPKLAAVAMATEDTRRRLNELTHPLVRKAVEEKLEQLTKENFQGVVIIEAALLIEAGYKEICDFLWYVHAPLADRIRRMKEKRGYSEDKIANILAGQLTEQEFFAHADIVIENPDTEKKSREEFLEKQISTHLKECLESQSKMC